MERKVIKMKSQSCAILTFVIVLSSGLFAAVTAATDAAQQAQAILDAGGVQGGLVVHVGCGDGKLTAALHANDRYLVHGLDTSADNKPKGQTAHQIARFVWDGVG